MVRKRLRNKLYTSKYLIQLFGYFSSIILLMFAAMIAVYSFTNKNTENAVFDKIKSNLETSAQMIDANMEGIRNIGLKLFSTEVVRNYFKYNSAESLELWAEQYRIIDLIAQNEAIFTEQMSLLYVFFTEEDKIYTSAGIYDKDFFFQEICRYESYESDYWHTEITNNAIRNILVLPSTNVKVRYAETENTIPVITTTRIGGHDAMVVANMSTTQMLNMLQGTTLTNSTTFLILDEMGTKILDTNETALSEEDFGEIINVESGSRYRDDYIFSYTSESSGWTYISIVPTQGVAKITNASIGYVLILGVGLTIIGIILAMMFSLRIYKPINSVVNELTLSCCEADLKHVQSNDLKALQTGVSVLIDNEKHYKVQFNEYVTKYIDYALQLMINGIPSNSVNQLKENLRNYYGFKSDSYLCVCVLFDFSIKFFRETAETEQNDIFRKMRSILLGLLRDELICYMLEGQGGIYTCLINCESNHPNDDICKQFMKLENVFRADAEYYTVSIGIGGHFTKIAEIKESYNQAMQAVRYCGKGDTFKLLDYNTIPVHKKVAFSFYEQKKIVNSVKLGKKDQLEQVLNEILDINNNKEISGNNMRELFRQLFSVGQRCLEECDNSKGELESENRIRLALQQEAETVDFSQLRKNVLMYFEDIYELANTKEIVDGNQQMSVIKKYIQDNYRENLSLDGIAEVMGISPKYLSHLFKQKTGTNLTEFVNVTRIEKAKDILRSTNIKVGDVYTKVGFDSIATFMRVFKKYEGYSPNEYRMLMSQQK